MSLSQIIVVLFPVAGLIFYTYLLFNMWCNCTCFRKRIQIEDPEDAQHHTFKKSFQDDWCVLYLFSMFHRIFDDKYLC